MIIRSMKKVLSSVIIAIFTVVYVAPVGLCLTDSPTPPTSSAGTITAAVDKPILRTALQPSSLKLEGEILLSKGNPKVNLSLRDSDVKQVLRMFADKAGLNIIFHDSVTGKVTMDLVNVPLNDAFKMIMQVTSLTYFVDKNTMIVTSSAAAQTLNLSKQEMMTIPVKYANAAILADFLNKNIFSINKPGLSKSQIAITNPGTNEILIFGTNNDYMMAKKVIAQFDVKMKEETFVVNHTTPKEMSDLICGMLFSSAAGSSSSGGSSSSSSSSGGGSSTGGAAGLALGTGIVACKANNSLSAGALSSINTTSLSVTYFPQRGTISVMGGSQQQLEMIRDFILQNDKKQQQAYLELSIIELHENGSKDFNNNWQVWSEFFSGKFDGTTATNPIYPNFFRGEGYTVVDPTATDPTAPLYQIAKFSGTPTITYTMNYLVSNGKGRVLANPRVMITNSEVSTIDLSSDYIKSVKSEVLSSGGGLAGGIQRTYEIGSDEGIKIELTPFISPDGYVTLDIKPEYSTIKEKVYAAGAGSTTDLVATLLQRRNLALKSVRIKDGETLVIGGMIKENETKTVSKIPVLGDLPGVGMFFRNTSSTKEKQELVIMITPKIIKDSEDVVNNPGATL